MFIIGKRKRNSIDQVTVVNNPKQHPIRSDAVAELKRLAELHADLEFILFEHVATAAQVITPTTVNVLWINRF